MAHKPNDTPTNDALNAYRKSLVRGLPRATRKLAAELLSGLLERVEKDLRLALLAQAISNRGRE